MNKPYFQLVFILVVIFVTLTFDSCRKAEEMNYEVYDERLSGGEQTVFLEGAGAFSAAFPTLSGHRMEIHEIGDAHFETSFIAAPSAISPGLGSIYNSNSCVNCHIGDGRGKPIENSEPLTSMLFRISIPGMGAHGGPMNVPGMGGQLQDKATFGHLPEANVTVQWSEFTTQYLDGTPVTLRQPAWSFVNSYIPIPTGMDYSARVAPPLHGLGLLEQVAENTLLGFADEHDLNGDNISGKPNYVWDELNQQMMLGRFGWKAEAATLDQQVAGAYHEDMGITSSLFSIESSFGQLQYDENEDEPEVADSILQSVVFYIKTLAVPARRKVTDETIKQGKSLFMQAKCGHCHVPDMRTKTDVTFPEASNQYIHPYTDLLLHDMGPGLSDGRSTYNASGSEWRTPPLWGIGLTPLVNGHNFYLHDGRARSLEEAVLWHGGEAQQAADFVRSLNTSDRLALYAFLRSL
jgi:CxxC motif-containing protein (DUF1111 family)